MASYDLNDISDEAVSRGLRGGDAGQAYAKKQQTGPYRGGLLNDFRGGDSTDGYFGSDRNATNVVALSDSDSDVRGAAAAQLELDKESNGDTGVSAAEQTALLNMYKGRIGMKNSLSEQIQGSDDLVKREQDLNRSTSGAALGQGLKHTRENYNGRGLLYSGLREGGENKVKSTAASQLAQSMAATQREGTNSKVAAQNAYASVDLANQQEMLKRSEEAFDTANANSIARRQAMQQLGSGLGAAAGAYFGGRSSAKPETVAPQNNNWAGNDYTQNQGLLNG